jgi:hypothetical protein
VLSGQRIERKEVGAPGEFDAVSDDELERALVERFSMVNIEPPGECAADTGQNHKQKQESARGTKCSLGSRWHNMHRT